MFTWDSFFHDEKGGGGMELVIYILILSAATGLIIVHILGNSNRLNDIDDRITKLEIRLAKGEKR